MAPDYPAAHSMDTTWYAVDAVGHVAAFLTGENGHAPDAAAADEYLILLRQMQSPGAAAGSLADDELAPELGFFVYLYGDEYDPIGTYGRTAVPAVPAHIDQLPPDIRDGCRSILFQDVRFSDTPVLQPLERWPCMYWYEERVAYVAADDRTVRPIPGKEAEFAAFIAQLRAERPDEAARYTFEGDADGV